MELHAVHHYILDTANIAGAVGLGQPTGHRQLFQTTWREMETEVGTIMSQLLYINTHILTLLTNWDTVAESN